MAQDVQAPSNSHRILARSGEVIGADAETFLRASKASATKRAYEGDMRAFSAWCDG